MDKSKRPESFLEMETLQAEHLGTLSIGSFSVWRDAVKVLVMDEMGTEVGQISVPRSDLDLETNQIVWDLTARLAKPAAEAVNNMLVSAFAYTAALNKRGG